MKTHIVKLKRKDRKVLESLVKNGKGLARVFLRAHVLLKSGQGLKDKMISEHLNCSERFVAAVRKRYCLEGLERALHDAPRSGKPRTIGEKDKAHIVALACTKAPEGQRRWTLDLLVEEAEKENISLGRTKVWTILRENELKPWREKNVVYSKAG